MLYYLYDNTLDGLLTVIYECLALNHYPDKIIPQQKYQPEFFVNLIEIKTNPLKANKLMAKLHSVSSILAGTVLYCQISEKTAIEKDLLEYIRLGLKYGEPVNRQITNPHVTNIVDLKTKVTLEIHRLKGLARFRQLNNGMFYAPLEPDYNVVPLLGRHFSARLADQQWVIHDTKRNIGIYYDLHQTEVINITPNGIIPLSKIETDYQQLWQTFFQNIAIKERKNPRLQKQFMPKRYWKYLVEVT